MADYDYGQLIDDFELGVDVMPDEDLTAYIERRRREFESKADGGSIGIEVLFGPKREDFNIGGRAKRNTPIDSRASVLDYANALQKVGGGTAAQKSKDLSNYIQSYTPKGAPAALATAAQFAQGILGVDLGTPQTRSMTNFLQKTIQDKIAQSGKLSGSIDYRDYGVQTDAKGQHPYGKGDASFTSPEFALATTLGKGDYSVDPKTGKVTFTGGTAYDFPKGTLPFGLGEFISKGGFFGDKALDYSPNVTLGSDFMKQFNQPKYPDYKTAALQSQYYKNNPSSLDPDLFKAAYAQALDTRYGTGQGGGTTTVGPEGQISTSFGNWDPGRTYSAYMGDTRTSGSGPFYDSNNPDHMTMASVMKSMYGAPGNINPYYADGGRVRAVSGGFLKLLAEGAAKGKKGIMELVESGKGRFDEFVETMNQNKKPSESFTSQNITADLIDGPITVEKMANLDSKTLNIIKNTYDNGLYKEMPEILKAGNLLERFTKVVKGERIVDYERAEEILGVPLKGNETLNDLFKIEFDTRPVEKLADGGRVGFKGGGHQDFPPFKGPKGKKRGFENVMDGPDAGAAARAYLAEQQQQKQSQPTKAMAPTPKPNLDNINYIRQSMNAYGFSEPEILKAITQAGYADGGRVGLFMGGDPLTGQALSIYNSMNAYGFDDQAIANALTEQGLYTPPGSGAEPPTTIQPIGFQGSDNTPKGLLPTFSKDLSGDSRFNYLTPQEQGVKYRFDRSVEPREGLMGLYDKTKNFFAESKFFQPKIKGTLGDRLLKQSQGMTIPSLTGAFAKLRSPFNPQSPTYNAALPMQLNFLEMGQVGDKSGLNLIGRNEGSGLLQYGADSVLSGKNVISGFGTNDYETALRNFISKMNANTKISDARKTARLAAAQAELDALMAKQAQEYKDSGTQAEVAALQKEIDSGKYSGGSSFAQSNQAAVGGGAKGKAANTDNSKSTGTSQGYTQHYARGGLATMFTRRR